MSKELLENTLTQNKMKDVYKNISNQEKTYTKKTFKVNYKIADKEENISTELDGQKETSNTAKQGDYIVTGIKGEKYILKPDNFKKKYNIINDNIAETKPVKIKAKKYTGDSFEFIAPWGETMIINNNDYLVNNNNEIYRIEKEAFHKTYKE